MELGQSLFSFLPEAETQVFPVIAATKGVIEFFFFTDQLINVGQIFIA
jgi:hypothetical protein